MCMCLCGRIWQRGICSSSVTRCLMVTRPGGLLRLSVQLRRASWCCWTESIGLTWELWLCCPGKPNMRLLVYLLLFDQQRKKIQIEVVLWLKCVWSPCRLLHDRELALYDGTRLLRWDRYLAMKEELELTDRELQERYLNPHPSPTCLWCLTMLLQTCTILTKTLMICNQISFQTNGGQHTLLVFSQICRWYSVLLVGGRCELCSSVFHCFSTWQTVIHAYMLPSNGNNSLC